MSSGITSSTPKSGVEGCDFHDLNQSNRYVEPLLKSKLILALPVTAYRPEAMRVSERVPKEGAPWFEVETFNSTLNRWVEQKSHPSADFAVQDANDWYPAPTANHIDASLFVSQLLDSVDSLNDITDQHGARTLNDLMHLYGAILTGGFIDYYPEESKALEIAKALPSGEYWAKYVETEYLAQTYVQQHTDNEPLETLPGAVMRLNTESRMVEVVRAGGQTMSFGGLPAIEAFATEAGLNDREKSRLVSLDALGNTLSRSGQTLNDVVVVENGRYIGPVLATKEGVAFQDTGRGKLVGHDLNNFEVPPKVGTKLDAKYLDGFVKAANSLSQDTHAVGISMHTR